MVMTFNSVSAEDELINKDSLLKKRTEQYLLSDERNSEMNHFLDVGHKKVIINPEQETSSFNLSNSSKQELINNSKLSLSPRKAQRLVGVYDIYEGTDTKSNYSFEITRLDYSKHLDEIAPNQIFFRYNIYYDDVLISYDEIGTIYNNLMLFHSTVIDITANYYVEFIQFRKNLVIASGLRNISQSQLLCSDVITNSYPDCFIRSPENVPVNEYNRTMLIKR
jgi:hypothetical protein